jgi:hypothetical protein
MYGPEGCSFAHNEIEQSLWTMEKDELYTMLGAGILTGGGCDLL